MKGDCSGEQYVSGYMSFWGSNGVFHVVEIDEPLVFPIKDRTYRDEPAVPSFLTFARKWLSESGQI